MKQNTVKIDEELLKRVKNIIEDKSKKRGEKNVN